MQIIIKKQISENCILGVGIIPENINLIRTGIFLYLNKTEIENFNKIKNEKRKKEWLSTRFLLFEITGSYCEIKYEKNGKPYLENNYNISVSHSHDIVAILLSKNQNLGIDIEKISDKIERIAVKFMHIHEINAVEEKKRRKFLYANWCAKETMFKIYSKGDLDYKKELKIEPFKIDTEGTFEGSINKSSLKKKFLLNYIFFNPKSNKNDEYLLVWHCGK